MQLFGKGIGGVPGAVTGSPAGAINAEDVTEAGKVTPGNTEGVAMPCMAVLEDRKIMKKLS